MISLFKKTDYRHFFSVYKIITISYSIWWERNRISGQTGTSCSQKSNLSLKVLHRLLKRLGWSPLMVTQDGYSPVGPVVGQDLGRNVVLPYRRVVCLRMSHQNKRLLLMNKSGLYHLWAPSTVVAGWLRHCRYGKLWLSDRPSTPGGACSE